MDLLGRLGNHPICWPRTRTRLPYRITMEHPFFTVDEFSKRLSVVRIIIFTLIDCDPRAIHRRRRSVCARAGPNNNRQEQQHPRDPFPLFASRKSTSWESKSVFHVRKMMYEFAYPNGRILVSRWPTAAWAKPAASGSIFPTRVKRISLNLCVPFVDTRGACWSKNAADPSPRALLRAIVAKNEGISFFTSLSFFLSFVRVPWIFSLQTYFVLTNSMNLSTRKTAIERRSFKFLFFFLGIWNLSVR